MVFEAIGSRTGAAAVEQRKRSRQKKANPVADNINAALSQPPGIPATHFGMPLEAPTPQPFSGPSPVSIGGIPNIGQDVQANAYEDLSNILQGRRGSGNDFYGGGTKTAGPKDEGYKDSRLLYQESMEKMNKASNILGLLQSLEGAELPPEAQQQLEYLREDTSRELAQLDYAINQTVMREQAFNALSGQGREQLLGALQSGQEIVNQAEASTAAGIGSARTNGMKGIADAYDNATAAAAQSQVEETGRLGSDYVIAGGAESDERRAFLEQQAADDITELQALTEQNVQGNADLSAQINKFASQAASTQLDLIGLQDEKDRALAQTQFETNMRNELYNLTQQRQDVERNAERIEASIREDAKRQQTGYIDQFGLGVDPTPEGIFDTVFTDGVETMLDRQGLQLDPIQRQQFDQYAAAYATATDEGTKTEALMLLSNITGLEPDELKTGLDRSYIAARETYLKVADGDYTNAKPGSQAFGLAIYNTVNNMGLDPQMAIQLANSPTFAEYVRTVSNGRAGRESGGNLKGLGALPEDIYEAYWGEPYENIKGDYEKELETLVAYVMSQYGGDPTSMLIDFQENKALDYGELRSRSTSREKRAR